MLIHKRGLRFLLALLIFVAVFWNVPQPERVVRAAFDDEDFMPGEVVVQLTSAGDLAGVAAKFSLDPFPLDQFGSRPIYRLRITDGARV